MSCSRKKRQGRPFKEGLPPWHHHAYFEESNLFTVLVSTFVLVKVSCAFLYSTCSIISLSHTSVHHLSSVVIPIKDHIL